ncbi:hypothetical protein FCM35_KLT05691 [Carex littledalei]|uniref:Uncharacterized protein n=1 Tax=Carex littledalei TaxID=544730 RepID=A0A833R1Q6_9POAL|nr:hypothetical protein FCM35_KLT05691 [Carex littledalei]
MILSVFSSLFLLSLARQTIDLATQPETQIETLLLKESNTTVLTLDPIESTDLDILESIEKIEEAIDTQLSDDESSERQVVVDSDPGMIPSEVIGWDPREDEEKKQEEVVRKKKKSKRLDDSDSDSESDSDSDSDSEDEEEEEERKKSKKKRGKKIGFWRFMKWINPFH